MYRLTDKELLEELQDRFEEQKRALHDLRVMTRKLNDVNKKLQESEEMKSNFLSNIRNEIVNPLSSIMALALQLMEDYASQEEISRMGKMLHSEAFNLDMQLRNIFAAAEIEAGELDLMVSRVDVLSLIMQTVKSFGNEIAGKRAKVNVICKVEGCAEGQVHLSTDAEKLQIVLMNLICNAIEYSPEDRPVDIRLMMHGTSLTIDIKDYGQGIAPELQDRVFDRFRQLDEGMSKMHRGHGLGLSIAKALTEFLHGTVSFVSMPGKGSTFTLTIPELEVKGGIDVFSDDGNEFIFEGDEEVL